MHSHCPLPTGQWNRWDMPIPAPLANSNWTEPTPCHLISCITAKAQCHANNNATWEKKENINFDLEKEEAGSFSPGWWMKGSLHQAEFIWNGKF